MQRAVEPKRARTEEPTEEDDGPPAGVDDWDLADHRREMTRVANRRAVDLLVPEREPKKPRTGKDGFLHHARYGLVGGVAYWAAGSLGMAVTLIVALIVYLDVVERVRKALPATGAPDGAAVAFVRPHDLVLDDAGFEVTVERAHVQGPLTAVSAKTADGRRLDISAARADAARFTGSVRVAARKAHVYAA